MFATKTILISFPLCIFLRVLLLLISWVWVALCRYFRFHLVICFVDICSNNVVSDGRHFTEYNYCFFGGYFFKVDVLFNMLMIFFFWSVLDKCFSDGCQVVTIIAFSFWRLKTRKQSTCSTQAPRRIWQRYWSFDIKNVSTSKAWKRILGRQIHLFIPYKSACGN